MTKIRWTDETYNPVTGCSHVSPGCVMCYAETLSLRFGWSKKPWKAQFAAENVILHPERLRKPYAWKTPKRVFVNSMSDWAHELVPFSFIDQIFDVMEDLPQHRFQLLTKRAIRMREYALYRYGTGRPPAHIWWGVTTEDQRRANERIPVLLATPAACRFLSMEPLLGPVDLSGLILPGDDRMHWIIVGGESGTHMSHPEHADRWMDHAWARPIRDLCVTHSPRIALYFKQSSGVRTEMGTLLQEEDGTLTQWEEYPDEMGLIAASSSAHSASPLL